MQSFYDNFKHEQNNVEQKINAQKALLNGIIYNCQIEILNKKISSMQDDLKNAKQGFDEKMREEIIKGKFNIAIINNIAYSAIGI